VDKENSWWDVHKKNSGGLPADLRPVGDYFFNRGEMEWDEWFESLAAKFHEQSAKDRHRFVAYFFPHLADWVTSAFELTRHSPIADYQYGLGPFRSRDAMEFNQRATGLLYQFLDEIGPDVTRETLGAHVLKVHGSRQGSVGLIFAAAMDAGGAEGDRVLSFLTDAATNSPPTGKDEAPSMGYHVFPALLSGTREECWRAASNALLGAKSSEGLRGSALSAAIEGHPNAFRHILHVVQESGLARFSSVVQNVSRCLGLNWDAISRKEIERIIATLVTYLGDDDSARSAALRGKDAEAAFFALWCTAFDDVDAGVQHATPLLRHASAEHRFAAVHFLGMIKAPRGRDLIPPLVEDPDIRVAARVLVRPGRATDFSPEAFAATDMFERLVRVLPRLPKKRTPVPPIVWPWTGCMIDREPVGEALIESLGRRSETLLIPLLPEMDASTRGRAMRRLLLTSDFKYFDTIATEVRAALVAGMSDASEGVRTVARDGLVRHKLAPADAPAIEALLTRRASGARADMLQVLLSQPPDDVVKSAERLKAAKNAQQREAGVELLKEHAKGARSRHQPKAEGEPAEQAVPAEIAPALADGLGLFDNNARTWADGPVDRGVALHTPTVDKLFASLSALHAGEADKVIKSRADSGVDETGTVNDWRFGEPDMKLDIAEDRKRLILADVWEAWWDGRGAELRDTDGFEMPRFALWLKATQWAPNLPELFPEFVKRPSGWAKDANLHHLLSWYIRLRGTTVEVDFCLDATETALARIPPERLFRKPDAGSYHHDDWRSNTTRFWFEITRRYLTFAPKAWTKKQIERLWRLERWQDQPYRHPDEGGPSTDKKLLPRYRAQIFDACVAFEGGSASEADILDMLIGTRAQQGFGFGMNAYVGAFWELGYLSRRRIPGWFERFTFLPALVERCRARLLEVELGRGDTPSAATEGAIALQFLEGTERIGRILAALGDRSFVRGWLGQDTSKETSFSHLTRISFPSAKETHADFAAVMRKYQIGERRQVELAVYAPQWAKAVEASLGWPGLTDAVWWVHAHTKGGDWHAPDDIKAEWEGDLSIRTPLSSADLIDGAVDVAWFHKSLKALGNKRLDVLYDAAKYASSGGGHSRARLFADAMTGAVSKKDLLAMMKTKRNQDAVRALGLLPLAKGAKQNADVLERYQAIQEFVRGAREFGSQRQASEKRAAQIGLENLARNAGYPDPIRLQWAMEAKAIEDLADGPITVKLKDVTVSLEITALGEIELSVARDGKRLADVPAPLKKDPKIAALRARKTEVKKQASRVKPSLEQLMIRGDTMTGAELQDLFNHPLLAPMLSGLVLIGEGQAGYPVKNGKALEDHAGKLHAVGKNEALRIAHPLDLMPAASWAKWQKECFARERIQPFKQVFRELYPLTAGEREERTQTSRYAGHQVHPRQALALLGQRGWVHRADEGIRKTFHDADLIAWLELEESFYTAAEVEGLTLDTVRFTRRKDLTPVPLAEIPARLFSEAMRDLDLVVSVAHRGGADPEVSASTIEMRAALVMHAASLLTLANVEVKDRYAIIAGTMAKYSVHLGSAIARKVPGETLIIVAVHSQHRGRVFLPFADDDPRSAEVLSKVLLLARDSEIKDPSILHQIRNG
jgi:hypothetical protein